MSNKGPKTAKGMARKSMTGDGRKDPVKKIQKDIKDALDW
jgi:hypothetical protein